ncbi:MAG: VWA domain-containing protein [Phycisphaerae bacterium]|nr:VWA domain-containing protein [Phycisphaerae bacterium]
MKRKNFLTLIATLGIMISAATVQEARSSQEVPPKDQQVVEVAFVLDTTGSMSGLINAAKQKIWSIANQVVTGKPKPKVRIGLVAFRDKGDKYVTKVFDLTDNIDQVYTDLMKFKADGGGDTPENVNQALYDAVNKLKWSKDKKTLRIIYLVGDSPPHNEYKDVPTYDKIAKSAIERRIYVNTILCGGNTETRKVWKEIALRSEGVFLAIAQDGGVKDIATPYDKKLSTLNTMLVKTVVVYGTAREQSKATLLNYSAASMKPSPAAADRAEYASNSRQAGSGDLVQALDEGKADLKKIKSEHLPKQMRKMSPEEQKKYIADMKSKRKKIHKQIKDLSIKRAEYIRESLKKSKDTGDSFDQQVLKTLKEQAKKVNIKYK